jgi:biotin carboxyl carrier protein
LQTARRVQSLDKGQSGVKFAREGNAAMSVVGDSGRRVEVRAPMSGIFYRRPAPDQPPFVEVGDSVRRKQVLALLETMKVFQKVKSPADGRIVEIVAQNETPLRDNDLILVIEIDA